MLASEYSLQTQHCQFHYCCLIPGESSTASTSDATVSQDVVSPTDSSQTAAMSHLSPGIQSLHSLTRMLETLSALTQKIKQLDKKCEYFENAASLLRVQNQWLMNGSKSAYPSVSGKQGGSDGRGSGGSGVCTPRRGSRSPRVSVTQLTAQRRRSGDRRRSGGIVIPVPVSHRLRSVSQDSGKLLSTTPAASQLSTMGKCQFHY